MMSAQSTSPVYTLSQAATMVTAKPNSCVSPRLWATTLLAVTSIAVTAFQPQSSIAVTAFQPQSSLHHTTAPSSLSPFGGAKRFSPSRRLFAVTDPDILLRDTARLRSAFDNLDALEKAYMSSSSDVLEAAGPFASFEEEEKLNVVTSPDTAVGIKSKPNGKQGKRNNRSSTMPGFSQKTSGQLAHEEGIKLMEQQSGRTILESTSQKKKRQKQQSELMYKTSASVPDSLVKFANEIHLEERITPKEEKELGAKTQEAIRILNLKQQLEERLDREPTDEEWCAEAGKINTEAVRQALEEGLEAKNRLVTANLRMVQGVVNIYIRNGLGANYNAGDMMQEGIMALIRAAEKFEPQRGFRFSTYAMYWIRAAVKRSQILQSRVIPVPQRLFENHKRLQRVEKELKESLGRDPTKKEMGEVIGMSEMQVERCFKAMAQRCYSLDQEITNKFKPNNGDRQSNSMYELMESKEDGEYKKLKRLFVREDLIESLNRHLDPEAARLLMLRYGLADGSSLPDGLSGPLTIAQVSELVGLKPDKVRRTINSSLKELKLLIGNEWEDFERELE